MKTPLKFKRAGSMFLAVFFLALFISVPAAAARPPIDGSKRGSIAIDLSAPTAGIEFTVYRVAKLSDSGGYDLTDDFKNSGLDLQRLSTAPASALLTAAKNLVSYISAHPEIAGASGVTNSSGIVKFPDLAVGYYLAVQEDNPSGPPDQIVCDPFFVPVPMESSDGKSWVYDIVAYAKCEAQSGAVILKKVNESDKPLSGAVFRLDKKVYDADGKYVWSIAVSELVTNGNGQIAVKGMPFATYRFIELRAPSGYRLNSTPHEFTVSKAGSIKVVDGQYVPVESEPGSVKTPLVRNSKSPHDNSSNPRSTPSTPSSSSTPSEVSEPSVPYAPPSSGVENVSEDQVPGAGFNLPKTGGSIAYAVCTFGGILLMLCGAVVFVVSRKKKR